MQTKAQKQAWYERKDRNYERSCSIRYEDGWRQALGIPSVFS